MPNDPASPEQAPADRYAVIGHPVAHSRSPMIHQLFARQTSEALTYELMDVVPEGFETAVRGFAAAGGKGANVTVPHKEAAFRLADELGEEAGRAEAVNTLSFSDGKIRGDNTDGAGLLRDLLVNLDEPVRGRRMLVLGAGGAARGILGPLLDAAPRELVVANRTGARAEALAARFAAQGAVEALDFEALELADAYDIVINATSVGLTGEPPPFPHAIVGPNSFCYDLSYSMNNTPFVRWAEARHARRAVQGWGMLIEQAAESFLIWRGKRPDTADILRQLID